MSVKALFLETRPQFLLLSPILVFLGMSMALYNGTFNTLHYILANIGLILLHASVNILNDYDDFKTGIDLKVNRTPFSGGSGILPAGLLTPRAVLILGWTTFLLAVPIGIYFVKIYGWHLLPLFMVGGIFVIWYTSLITKIGAGLAEICAGLGLGTLPVYGTYIIMGGKFDWGALYASVPSGFLVFNLLLLNEFPDADADLTAHRKTIPIIFGHTKAGLIYSTLVMMTYSWVAVGAVIGLMPLWTLLCLLTLPIGIKAIKGSLTYGSFEKLIPAQGANVMIVLLIQLLIGIGYMIAHFAG
jgi:1,4-dihydroxy-2-naphthoate polyprenyltransferase